MIVHPCGEVPTSIWTTPEHQLHHRESPAENVLPVAAEEVQPAKDNDGAHLIESILYSSITIWYAAATAKDKGSIRSAWLQSAIPQDPEACR